MAGLNDCALTIKDCQKTGRSATQADGLTSPRSTCCFNVVRFVCANRANRFSGKYSGTVELDCCIAVVFLRQRFCQRTWPLLPVGATLGLRLNYEFPKAAGLFPFLSPEHHNYPNYYHHRNPRSPYDIDRSPVWYVQKLCHHYCEPANHPPRFALSLHGVRRVGRFNALALLKSRDAFRSASIKSAACCELVHHSGERFAPAPQALLVYPPSRRRGKSGC